MRESLICHEILTPHYEFEVILTTGEGWSKFAPDFIPGALPVLLPILGLPQSHSISALSRCKVKLKGYYRIRASKTNCRNSLTIG